MKRLVLVMLGFVACKGRLEEDTPGPRLVVAGGADAPGDSPGEDPAGEEPGVIEPPGVVNPASCGPALPPESPRLSRLSHRHYDFVASDLLGIEVNEAGSFAPDPVLGGFDNNAEALRVDARLLGDYQGAAERLAQRVVETPAAYAALVSCAPDAVCAAEVIRRFGMRAFRRPLTEAESARYVTLFNAAADLYSEGTVFERGVRAVVEAVLQSPTFLYRAELDEQRELVGEKELVRLSGFTVASRLAATLWGSNPDDELLAAAAAGSLDTEEGIRAQASRMTASPKLERVIDDFHAQWMGSREFGAEAKMPALPAGAGDSMRAELRQFVQHVLDNDGGYTDLMTAPFTFADSTLAAIYGVPADSPAPLDPTQRSGLLTQIGLMSTHASSADSSPILRGVFVMRRFLCSDINPPDFAIDPTLPPRDDTIVTTRDQVAHHTSNATCQACHKSINALGFALEHYDARGAWRDLDNGAPVDATSEVQIGDQVFPVDGAVDLAAAFVDSGAGGRCYIDKWLGYSFGRAPNDADHCTAAAIDAGIAAGGHKLRDVLAGITTSVPFRYRLPEE